MQYVIGRSSLYFLSTSVTRHLSLFPIPFLSSTRKIENVKKRKVTTWNVSNRVYFLLLRLLKPSSGDQKCAIYMENRRKRRRTSPHTLQQTKNKKNQNKNPTKNKFCSRGQVFAGRTMLNVTAAGTYPSVMQRQKSS